MMPVMTPRQKRQEARRYRCTRNFEAGHFDLACVQLRRGGFFDGCLLSPITLTISSAEMRCARRASLTRALCFVYSLLITELNGMYLGLAGTFGASLRGLDNFSSLLSRFTWKEFHHIERKIIENHSPRIARGVVILPLLFYVMCKLTHSLANPYVGSLLTYCLIIRPAGSRRWSRVELDEKNSDSTSHSAHDAPSSTMYTRLLSTTRRIFARTS